MRTVFKKKAGCEFCIYLALITGFILFLAPIIFRDFSIAYADQAITSVTVEVSFIIEETITDIVDLTEEEPGQEQEVKLVTETGTTASVVFTPEAVPVPISISISSIERVNVSSQAPIPSSVEVVGDLVYEFTAEVVEDQTSAAFDQPVTLTFTYTDTNISNLDESNLRIYYWNETGQEWVLLPGQTLDTVNNVVTVAVFHFTLYALMAPPTPSPPSPGGGGGGGFYVSPPVPTKVILQGLAYPGSLVTILEDGKVSATVSADSYANFKIEITDITAGIYTFNVWTEDSQGRKPAAYSFTTNVSSGVITTISGIFLPPTIELDKDKVTRGDDIKILGQTTPESNVSIYVYSAESPIIKQTKADLIGVYFYNFNTSPLEVGIHDTKTKSSTDDGLISDFSKSSSFLVLSPAEPLVPEIPAEPEVLPSNLSEDFTKEGKDIVDIIDVSILLYNWGIPKNPKADLNSDGKVDLVDFSIMLYYWTG